MMLVQSSPPRWVSPLVESTSKTPSPSTDTSNVPPPRSEDRDLLVLLALVEGRTRKRGGGLVDDANSSTLILVSRSFARVWVA